MLLSAKLIRLEEVVFTKEEVKMVKFVSKNYGAKLQLLTCGTINLTSVQFIPTICPLHLWLNSWRSPKEMAISKTLLVDQLDSIEANWPQGQNPGGNSFSLDSMNHNMLQMGISTLSSIHG